MPTIYDYIHYQYIHHNIWYSQYIFILEYFIIKYMPIYCIYMAHVPIRYLCIQARIYLLFYSLYYQYKNTECYTFNMQCTAYAHNIRHILSLSQKR
jgi:hypothetical protein